MSSSVHVKIASKQFAKVDIFKPLLSRPWVDVRDYGAKGDGVTDDTAAIQAAITSLSLGGVVSFPSGIYKISSTINIGSNITLRGVFAYSTLRMAGSQDGIYMLSVNNKNNIIFRDLILDGNKVNVSNSGGACLVLNTTEDVTMDNCQIINSPSVGIYGCVSNKNVIIQNSTVKNNGKAGASNGQGIFFTDYFNNIKIRNTFVSDSLTDGILLNSLTSRSSDVFIEQNLVRNNTRIGIYLAGGTYRMQRVIIADNISTLNRDNILVANSHSAVIKGNVCSNSAGDQAGDGLVISGCDSVVIMGNVCYYNRARGIYICSASETGSYRITIIGNISYDNNRDQIEGVSGIDIMDTYEYACIGNEVSSPSGDKRQKYNIATNSQSANMVFAGNVLLNGLLGDWNILGYGYEKIANNDGKVGTLKRTEGTAPPTSGTWARGSVCWNTQPSAGGTSGWLCVVGGTPGTWKGFGAIEA